MKYTADQFNSDLQEVAYLNDPKKALSQLKRIHGKMKDLIEKKYNFRLGKVNTEKKGKNFYVSYPVIGEDVNEDELWNTVEKPLSLDVFEIIDDAKLDEIWAYEGIRQGSSGDIVEVLLYLK